MSAVQLSLLPLVALPVISLSLLSLTVLLSFRFDWISSLSLGFPGVVGLLWVATELQFFRPFSRGSLALALMAVALAGSTTFGVVVRWKREQLGSFFRRALAKVSWSTRLLLVGFLALDAFLIVVLCFAEPNNWDSMTYHLPRVEHWLDRGSVDYYPASDNRQLFMPPLGGYLQLWTLQIFNNYFVLGILQFVYFNLLVVLAAYLAWRLLEGTNRVDLALVAGILVGTTPIVVAQATTTQVDLLAALLPVLLVSLLVSKQMPRLVTWLAVPLIVGVASAVKQYALIAVIVVILWAAVFKLLRFRDLLLVAVGSAATLALFLGPQIARNLQAFGSPLGPGERLVSTQAQLPVASWQSFVLNVAMYVGINLPIPSGIDLRPVLEWLASRSGASFAEIIDLFQLDRFLVSPGIQLHEDSAPNPLQFVLGSLALLILILRRSRRLWSFLAVVGLSLLLFQLMLTLGGIGTVRYLVGFFVLSSVALVVVLRRRTAVLKSITLLSLLASVVLALNFEYRPLLGRESVLVTDPIAKLFLPRPAYESSFRDFADFVGTQPGVTCVHLDFDSDAWEFPIWWLAARDTRLSVGPTRPQVECDRSLLLRSRSDLNSYWIASIGH